MPTSEIHDTCMRLLEPDQINMGNLQLDIHNYQSMATNTPQSLSKMVITELLNYKYLLFFAQVRGVLVCRDRGDI